MADKPPRRSTRPKNARKTSAKGRKEQLFAVLRTTARVNEAARQRRARIRGVLSKVIVVVGLGAGLYYGVSTAATRLLFKNPEYDIADVNVETDGVLAPATVVEASDLHKGVNIFKVDLGRAKARVEAIPQVESAQVTRNLPNKVSIQVTERKPIAWIAPEHGPATRDEIAASAKSFLIDSRGILLQPGKTQPQDYHLPIIRNYTSGPLSAGLEAGGEEIKAALDLLHAHQDSLIASRFQIQEIDLSKHYGLNVLGESGVLVLFDLNDMDKQLKRLDVYLQTLEPRGQRVATINLLAQRNIPVTFITEPVPDANPASTPGAADTAPVTGTATKPAAPASKEKAKTKTHEKEKEKEKPKARTHPRESKQPHKPSSAPTVRRALPVNPTP